MTAEEKRIKSLELAIEEQRRDWDALNQSYEGSRTKNVTYLAASFALLAYLYASNIQPNQSLKEKLFIPNEPYGAVIYALAAGLYIFSIALLLYALKPRLWSTAYDNEQEAALMNDHEEYLKYMQKRYLRSSKINLQSYATKQSLLDMSFPPLVMGGILLLVLKIFA